VYKWFKRSIIVLAFTTLVFGSVYAATSSDDRTAVTENYPFIENMKLDSTRYTRVDDLSTVDPTFFVPIEDTDQLVASNPSFNLYFDEEYVSFKVLNKETGYVWSTNIKDADAGTFSSLLQSGIGIEYINVQKDMTISENIGITETVFVIDTEPIEDGLLLHLNFGGYCAKRTCERLYPDYLDGKYTKEEMVEYGLTEINISFDVNVTLTDEGLEANVPYDSIEEGNPEEIVLASIILFPSLGATYMDDIPGYMVLPEGSGALIRYEDNEGKYITPFIERYYGENMGLYEQRESVLSYPLSMPIFGAVHGVNQNAMIGIIEEGNTNARLFSFPNGAL